MSRRNRGRGTHRTSSRGSHNHRRLIGFALFIVAVIGIYFYLGLPGLPGKNLSLISVSQVSIQPGGSADSTGRWTGTYWIVTGTVDASESSVFYQLDPSASGTSGNQVINPKSTIQITLTPMQPYYQRQLTYHTIEVVSEVHPAEYSYMGGYSDPDTGAYYPGYSTWTEQQFNIVPQLDLGYYTFATSTWEQHTPFQVTVTKLKADGSTDFTTTQTIDTFGGVNNVVIQNPNDASQQLVISGLGQIGTGYSQPTFGNNMILLDATHNVIDKDNNLMNIIGYDRSDSAYSEHFYGGSQWRWDDGTPKPPTPDQYWSIFDLGPNYNAPKNYPGWGVQYNDYSSYGIQYWTYDYSVNQASISDMMNYISSLNYVVNTDLNAQTWGQGVSINNNVLRINLPYGSVSSLITMKIPTEMADSYVYKPNYGTFAISDASWSSGSTLNYNTAAQLNVKVSCSYPGTFNLQASSSTSDLSITPAAISDTMTSGEVQTYSFNVKNTGVQSAETGLVSFALKDSSGAVDDSKTLSFTLNPIYYTVTIIVKDASGASISGAKIVMGSTTLYTDSGGSAAFSGLPSGSYNFVVTKTGYNDYSDSVTVNSADVTKTITMTAVSTPPTTHTVTITVKDSQSSIAIPGATVILSGTQTLTDSGGSASFSGLASGTYSFTISKTGYSGISDNVIVASNDVSKSELMTPMASPDPTGEFYINNNKVTSSSIIKTTSAALSLKVVVTSQGSSVTDVEITVVQGTTTLADLKKSSGGVSASGDSYTATYNLPASGSYVVTAKLTANAKTISLSVAGVNYGTGGSPLPTDYTLYLSVILIVVVAVAVLVLKKRRRRWMR